jgi:hypothetical protein
MHKYSLLIILAFLLACQHKKHNKKYFEGYVEFSEQFTPAVPGYMSYFKKIWGERMITYVNSEGCYSREFIDSNNIIIRREVFRPDSMCIYNYFSDADTMSRLRMDRQTVNNQQLDIQAAAPVIILGKTRKGFRSFNKMFNKHTGFYDFYSVAYYGDETRPLNPENYRKSIATGWNKIFEKAPYVTVFIKSDYKNFGQINAVATKIVDTDVPDARFLVPKNKVVIDEW